MSWPEPPPRKMTPRQVALLFEVPYWLIGPEPRPSWWQEPRWRWRVLRWEIRDGMRFVRIRSFVEWLHLWWSE